LAGAVADCPASVAEARRASADARTIGARGDSAGGVLAGSEAAWLIGSADVAALNNPAASRHRRIAFSILPKNRETGFRPAFAKWLKAKQESALTHGRERQKLL
jgi:hypothetical protein